MTSSLRYSAERRELPQTRQFAKRLWRLRIGLHESINNSASIFFAALIRFRDALRKHPEEML
jgi:hypothetical protein